MAIIACPECGANVSDKAPACIQCGAPLASASETHAAGAPLTTMQGTSKKLKAQSLIYGILLMLGIIFFITDIGNSSSGDTSIFAFLWVLLSLIWFVVTKARIWWHHS